MDIKKILAALPEEKKIELKRIVQDKDDDKLEQFINIIFKNLDNVGAGKVQASTIASKGCTLKYVDRKGKVTAYVNTDDFKWMRFKGKVMKRLPFAGMHINLQPEEVIGISKVCDPYGQYKVVIPSYRKSTIALDKHIVELLENRCKPYSGNIKVIFKPALGLAKGE